MRKLTDEEQRIRRRKEQKRRCGARRTKYRHDMGLCIYCGVPSRNAVCDACRAYYNAVGKQKRKDRRAAHLCTVCGKPLPDEYTYSTCESCRAMDKVRHARERERKKK